jgi:hypothetical protein
MGDGLEGLVDACLSQAVMHRPRLAERVPGIPDDILDVVAAALGIQPGSHPPS